MSKEDNETIKKSRQDEFNHIMRLYDLSRAETAEIIGTSIHAVSSYTSGRVFIPLNRLNNLIIHVQGEYGYDGIT